MRKIVISGVAELFYRYGFPITMSIQMLNNAGYEVSLLHISDQLIKHGWSSSTVINKLKSDAESGINNEIKSFDWKQIEIFCNMAYENQREMLFNYLFSSKELAEQHLNTIINQL